jgi:hypothetical protein
MATKFIGLYDKDAVKTAGSVANSTSSWKWTLPTNLNSRQAPTCRLSVASAYLDDSYPTAVGNQNFASPRMLRMKIFSENFLQNETSTTMILYPIMGIMNRDAIAGHWILPQAPHQIDVDFSTSIRTIEFDFVDEDGLLISTLQSATVGGKFNMVLKLEYPPHNEIRNEVVKSYTQSEIGNPPFNKL